MTGNVRSLRMCAANKVKVLYGIPRDPDVTTALAQLEEEENDGQADDEKPKVCVKCVRSVCV